MHVDTLIRWFPSDSLFTLISDTRRTISRGSNLIHYKLSTCQSPRSRQLRVHQKYVTYWKRDFLCMFVSVNYDVDNVLQCSLWSTNSVRERHRPYTLNTLLRLSILSGTHQNEGWHSFHDLDRDQGTDSGSRFTFIRGVKNDDIVHQARQIDTVRWKKIQFIHMFDVILSKSRRIYQTWESHFEKESLIHTIIWDMFNVVKVSTLNSLLEISGKYPNNIGKVTLE